MEIRDLTSLIGGANLESRKVPRYPVQAPVTFTWSEEGQAMQGNGWTRDISEVGVFVYSAQCPPPGSETQLEVVLPPLGEAGRILRIRMEAAVLRVSAETSKPEGSGFALKSHHAILKSSEEILREEADGTSEPERDLFGRIPSSARIQGQKGGFAGKRDEAEEEEES